MYNLIEAWIREYPGDHDDIRYQIIKKLYLVTSENNIEKIRELDSFRILEENVSSSISYFLVKHKIVEILI